MDPARFGRETQGGSAMLCYLRCRLARRLLGIALVPPALWTLIVLFVPTDWAKARLVNCLTEATGHSVRLAELRLGLCGGIWLRGLQISEHQPNAAPWLRVDELRLNLNLLHLLAGQLTPSRVEAEGLTLRVHRRRDGSLEFGDLLRAHANSSDPGADPTSPKGPTATTQATFPPVAFVLKGGQVNAIDDPTETDLEFHDVEAQGTWRPGLAAIQELSGQLNGGWFELAAQLDRSGATPAFEVHARAQRVALDVGMGALRYVVPVFTGNPASIDGQLDLNVYLRGQGATAEELKRTLAGQGTIAIDLIQLDGSKLIAELASLWPLPPRRRVGSVRSRFAVGRGRIANEELTLQVGQVPILLSGWTDFEGQLDYQIQPDGLPTRLPRAARDLLAELPVNFDQLPSLHVQGTISALEVRLDGIPLDGDRLRSGDARLQELGTHLLDQIRR
jgi:hypothetical protein